MININDFKSKTDFEEYIKTICKNKSSLNSYDAITKETCEMEGIVMYTTQQYKSNDSGKIEMDKVFKVVRKGHVKIDEHWSKNWKVAKLITW